jgi:hypothetical protein
MPIGIQLVVVKPVRTCASSVGQALFLGRLALLLYPAVFGVVVAEGSCRHGRRGGLAAGLLETTRAGDPRVDFGPLRSTH